LVGIQYIDDLGFSETNKLDSCLLVEVWDKGMIWDTKLGAKLIRLQDIRSSNEVFYEGLLSNK